MDPIYRASRTIFPSERRRRCRAKASDSTQRLRQQKVFSSKRFTSRMQLSIRLLKLKNSTIYPDQVRYWSFLNSTAVIAKKTNVWWRMWQQRLLNELYLTLKKAEEIALAMDLAPKQEVGIQSMETTPSKVQSNQLSVKVWRQWSFKCRMLSLWRETWSVKRKMSPFSWDVS